MAASRCQEAASLGITRGFPRLCPTLGLVTFALLTLPPLALRPVRLACLIHAANVHSEPGSNPSRLGRRPKTSPFLGFEESDITNWSPRVRVRGKINPLPHAPRQHEPSDSTPIPFETLVENCRTASTPATLKGSLNSFCVMADDRPDCQRGREGSIPPSTRPAGAPRPKQSETPAAYSHPAW